jgi:predicted naringenin-chalcone synthase
LSTKVPSLIAKHLRPWLDAWLAKLGETVDSIGSWAIHPGGPRVLSAVAESLGLDEQATAASGAILTRYGNMSSPTVLFIVDQLRRASAPRPCVALAFGPGLAVEAAMFR